MTLFGDETITDQLLHPLRDAATRTAALGAAVNAQAMRERDAILGAFGVPEVPENVRKIAAWGGVVLTIVALGALVYHKKKKKRGTRK